MLAPKKVKHRKVHRGRRRGTAKGGTEIHFGDFGLVALEAAWITNRQIEAARVAITRHIRRGGKVWINIFPDKPVHQEAGRDPDGLGQGQPGGLGRRRQAGSRDVRAVRGLRDARARGDVARRSTSCRSRRKFITRPGRGDGVMASKASELREPRRRGAVRAARDRKEELFNLRFQLATGQLDNPMRIKDVRHEVARILTIAARTRDRGARARALSRGRAEAEA